MLWLDAPTSLFSLSQTSSDIRFWDRNPALSRSDIADCWLRNEYLARLIISQLEQVLTQWNAILFQLVYGSTHQSVYSYYQSPVQSAKEASNLQSKLWENRDLNSAASNYLCLSVWERWHASCLYFFSNRPSVMDQKPKWNVRLASEPI